MSLRWLRFAALATGAGLVVRALGELRVGKMGLDTSPVIAFTKLSETERLPFNV